ncbi:MAG: hypothetical protein AAF585_16235 [Verrucomicrobiota bacterium]
MEHLKDAKRRVFSKDVDGIAPFLNPWDAVSEEHLQRVKRRTNLTDEQLQTMIEEMNAELGWDIRVGKKDS